jgi:uncharacterized protein YndB with AHSA1/START domain
MTAQFSERPRRSRLLARDAVYQDIVPHRRIVFAYAMSMAGNPLSVSLARTQLFPEGSGTHPVFTEQGAYFGGPDDVAGREEGSRGILERLAEEIGG